jgi:GR25 family glycosyltransferase involved in LPS biosynthesis
MKGVYINLEDRKDRREHFENQIKKNPFFANIERMQAIEKDDHALGCSLSHITALSLYDNTEEPFIGIFEDDFMILEGEEENLVKFIKDFEKIKESNDWKVIVLTPRGTTIESTNEMKDANFRQIKDHQTATGYIVKKDFIEILRKNMEEAVYFQQEGVNKNFSATDQYWKRLQEKFPFYYYSGIFAGQLPGWSNIENQVVDYNDRFRKQPQF